MLPAGNCLYIYIYLAFYNNDLWKQFNQKMNSPNVCNEIFAPYNQSCPYRSPSIESKKCIYTADCWQAKFDLNL